MYELSTIIPNCCLMSQSENEIMSTDIISQLFKFYFIIFLGLEIVS